ncbi:winged helix-turn-helix transcriptional regulator [Streptomyces camponoticapitis]|uniref:winged helix-turn-helix transcriptional regulator n=1 Tax=Streptomyces camponoticapitis TaxID=1616125 RepID=UPI003570E23D
MWSGWLWARPARLGRSAKAPSSGSSRTTRPCCSPWHGRASHVSLATAAGISPARATRRVRALLDAGVVHLDVELSRAALGFTTRADLWIQVAPTAIRAVGGNSPTCPRSPSPRPSPAYVTCTPSSTAAPSKTPFSPSSPTVWAPWTAFSTSRSHRYCAR